MALVPYKYWLLAKRKRRGQGSWQKDMTVSAPFWQDWLNHVKACDAIGQKPMAYPEYRTYRYGCIDE